MLRARGVKQLVAAALVAGVVAVPVRVASAFDSFWHSAASAGAGQQHGFTADAVNILQFGTFGPDFFGPLYDTIIGERIEKVQAFFNMRLKENAVRKAGVFMHFDNLYGALDRDWKVDYLFRRLLANTRQIIKSTVGNSHMNEGTRRLVTLIALGSSLHMVEDFYSHSDWTHFDFVKLGFPQRQSIWHQDYAPSWFQVEAKLGPPAFGTAETWPIEVRSGIYPPPAHGAHVPTDAFGVPLDHTFMNHDNSQLFYDKASQIKWHGFGAHPATNAATAKQHQLYAVNSAAMAANEWVDLVEQDLQAKAAIDDARSWQLARYNPAMQHDLEEGLKAVLMLSCLAHRWDGEHPAPAQATPCKAFNYTLAVPNALNEYWGAYARYAILEHLTQGIGDANGHYTFDEAWYRQHRTARP